MNPDGGIPFGTFPDGPPGSEYPISDDQFITAATSAQSVTINGQSFTERSAADMIAIDTYLKGRQLKGNGWGAIGIARAIPPSASGREWCDRH